MSDTISARAQAAATGTLLFDPHMITGPLAVGASYVLQRVADAEVAVTDLTESHPLILAGVQLVEQTLLTMPVVSAVVTPIETIGKALLGFVTMLSHINDTVAATPVRPAAL